MIRLATLIVSLLLASLPGPALSTLQVQQLHGFNVISTCLSPSVSFLSAQTSTTNATSYTFSAVSIGSATVAQGCQRIIVAWFGCDLLGAASDILLTIAGTSAVTVETRNAPRASRLSYLPVSSGTTADFIVSSDTGGGDGSDLTCERVFLLLWRLEVGNLTPRDSGQDTSSAGDFDVLDIAAENPGIQIAGLFSTDSDGGCAWAYNGADIEVEDADAALEAANTYAGYHVATTEAIGTNDWNDSGCSGAINEAAHAAVGSWR